jgi:cyclopropane fatty-acyl-phospholipid synthase-like methyltransferase
VREKTVSSVNRVDFLDKGFIMVSPITQGIANLYTKRHALREGLFEDKPYANFGYWTREGMSIEEACDAMTDLVARAAALEPGDRVLEVGCGYSASAVYYATKYRPASVVGIDVTEIRIQKGREFVAQKGLADVIQVRLGDATALDFPNGAFTKIVAIECAFHFDTRQAFFHEANRVLVPGGRMGLADIIIKPGVDRDAFLARVHPVLGDGSLNVPANVHDAQVYTQSLQEAGFDDIRIDAVTDQTIPPFSDHLDRTGQRIGGERGDLVRRVAQTFRDYYHAGLEYIIVSARKARDL